MPETLTLLHPEGRAEVSAVTEDGCVRITPDAIRDALGWELKESGLCREEVCVPVADRAALVGPNGIDLSALADALGLPLAVDADARAAAVGTPHADRAAGLASGQAPDFALPDLSGRIHTLSEHRGKKVLLIAYASW